MWVLFKYEEIKVAKDSIHFTKTQRKNPGLLNYSYGNVNQIVLQKRERERQKETGGKRREKEREKRGSEEEGNYKTGQWVSASVSGEGRACYIENTLLGTMEWGCKCEWFKYKESIASVTTWMALEDTHSAKWNKSEKDKYCVISLIHIIGQSWTQRVEWWLSGAGTWGKWRDVGQRL